MDRPTAPAPNIIELALQHGASSYRNRSDTAHPAYGFTERGLMQFAEALVARARPQIAALHTIAQYPATESLLNMDAANMRKIATDAVAALPATEESSAGDQELSRISGGEKPKPWTGAEKSELSKALAAVFGHEAKVQEFLGFDMHAEGRDPVEMLDRNFAIYQRSMGKPAPDAEMAQIVATTKEMIFSWWAEHRELIREALTATRALPADALETIRQTVRDYHYALDTRQHGGVAAHAAVDAIETALGMTWHQGKEAGRRAAAGQARGAA